MTITFADEITTYTLVVDADNGYTTAYSYSRKANPEIEANHQLSTYIENSDK